MNEDSTKGTKYLRTHSGGTRFMFRDDLKDIRAEAPRKTLNRQISAYMDPDVSKRPLFGIHQLARLTEYFLHITRNGREDGRKFLKRAEDLFFEVRTRQRSILANHGANWKFDDQETALLRVFVLEVAAKCRSFYADLRNNRKVTCPICGGKGTVYEETAVKAVQFAKKLLEERRITRDEIPFAMF